MLYLLIILTFSVLLVAFLCFILLRKEEETVPNVHEDFSDQSLFMEEEELMKKLEQDVNKSKKPWEAFIGRYNEDPKEPYLLFQGNDDQAGPENAILRARVNIDNASREISIYDNQKKKIVLIANEIRPNIPTYRGSINGQPFHMRYRDTTDERVLLKVGQKDTQIIGQGVKGHRNSLPHPWFLSAPLVFRERGNVPTAAMVYPHITKTLSPTTQSIPMEISIPEERRDDLALYFFTYIALQEALRART